MIVQIFQRKVLYESTVLKCAETLQETLWKPMNFQTKYSDWDSNFAVASTQSPAALLRKILPI